MKLKKINIFFLLLLYTTLTNAEILKVDEILKFSTSEKKRIYIKTRESRKVFIKVYKIPKAEIKKALIYREIDSKKITHNLIVSFTNILHKQHNFIELKNLNPGCYLIQINDKNEYYKLCIVTKLKIITKQYEDNLLIWAVNLWTGVPYKRFKLQLGNSILKQKKDYFYNIKLLHRDNIIIANYNNNYDIIYPTPLKKIHKELSFIKILPEKKYYQLKEILRFTVILREYKNSQYIPPPISSIRITIYDSKNNIIIKRNINNINNGIYKFEQIIGEEFKEGVYKAEVLWEKNRDIYKFIVLQNHHYTYIFRIKPEKFTYSHNDKIKLTVKVYHLDGTKLRDGMMRCEIWAKKLNQNNFHLFKILKKKIKRGKVYFKFLPDFLSKKFNYELKIILKCRSNNGIVESDYVKIKVINSDFKIKINSKKNLYEIGTPVKILYKIEPLNSSARIDKCELFIYKISDIEKKFPKNIVYKKESFLKKSLEGEETINLKKDGFYKATIKIKSKSGRIVSASTFFYIISYTYGLTIKGKIKNIIIIPDKDEYSYSDIGKALILLPHKNIWCNISIENEKVFASQMVLIERNFLIFDFPIYEKYSPNVYLNVTYAYKNKIFSKSINLKVPLIIKMLKIKSEILDEKLPALSENRLKFQTYNIWGHKIIADVISSTLNYDFIELYNHRIIDLYKIWYPLKNNLVITANLKKKKKKKTYFKETKKKFTSWDFFYSPYLNFSSLNYDLITTQKDNPSILKVKYPDIMAKWITLFYGVTCDSKTGIKKIAHSSEKGIDVNYFIPEFLTTKDKIFISASIQNYKNIPLKVKFMFNIINGKFISNTTKLIKSSPQDIEEIFLFLKPLTDKTIKIGAKWVSPLNSSYDEFFISVISPKKIYRKKNKYLKLKKKFYYLKYYEKKGRYYSKPKNTGKHFKRNQDILVEIRLKTKKEFNNLTLIDFLPAGCKFVIKEKYKYHLTNISPDLNYSIINKLNKIIIKIPYLSKGKHHIYYIIRPYLSGKFYIPPIYIKSNNKIIFSTGKDTFVKI